jgi:hypothetical protein
VPRMQSRQPFINSKSERQSYDAVKIASSSRPQKQV